MKRVSVRRSPVHGRGVFALRSLVAGERVFEYKGEVISWRRAANRYRQAGNTGHTFLFGLTDGHVIDGGRGGNSARWLNHACDANCTAFEIEGRVFIEAAIDIAEGEELCISYALAVDDVRTDEVEEQYACHCGSRSCRGTMLGDS
ncbi:SET domain-containing protein [Paraburkholderia phenoliruptrix]|uniref:SET domain-containing protein n=1 Tax=Paraburkholderia phenoliruptrix TaxID=252970 RepID=UPI000554865F|nr:SET domain-containing protein-lysine N-methyltransferase [Paraburkholderia phenoliruptrix]